MEDINRTLRSVQNKRLLVSLVSSRVKSSIGVVIDDDYESINTIQQVADQVIYKELERVKHLNISEAVLKVNNIIIYEAANFIMSQIDKTMEVKLENDDTALTLLKNPPIKNITHDEDTPSSQGVSSKRKTISYHIDSDDLVYDNGIYIYKGDMEGISEIKVSSISLDNIDYNVSELRNIFAIDQKEISVVPGNYNQSTLFFEVMHQLPDYIVLTMNKPSGKYIFSSKKPCKIDFTMKNSLYNVLGFERKIYSLKENEPISGDVCLFKNTPFVDASLTFKYQEEIRSNTDIRIPMDVGRGATKIFYPVEETITNYPTMDKILISFKDFKKNEYKLRNRNFYISLTIQVNFLY